LRRRFPIPAASEAATQRHNTAEKIAAPAARTTPDHTHTGFATTTQAHGMAIA
jgi:hypothetical protein